MNFYRTRRWIVALLALVLVVAMAGCKSESPTAPSSSGGGAGGVSGSTGSTGSTGTVTPPVGATVTLTLSNATPVVDSSSTITATVSSGGTAVPNGTAVEYQTDFGSFVQGASPAVTQIIKTTTNGAATAQIFSSDSGVATITATVNNVTKAIKVTFVPQNIVNPPASTAPTITGVVPSVGSPAGGQQVTITGTNLRAPVKVLFDLANGTAPIEVPVASQNESAITVTTPKINIAAGQQQKVNITVITLQGSANEQRVSTVGAFTYQSDVLTPAPTTASPASGPIDGGTRVTIFGSGFQAPLVQVFFGAAEAQIIKTTFDQIVVISPPARNAGVTTGPVNIRIINITSAKEATLTAGFRYAEKIAITAVGPTQGPMSGGTRVTIQGSGFDTAGIVVVIGGIAAQPVFVSGTQLIAITGAPAPAGCSNIVGPTTVVNINNGESADGVPFTFLIAKPVIVNVTSPIVLGGNAQITVVNATGISRITIGGLGVPITNTVVNPDGSTTFTVVVPLSLPLTTVTCGAGGLAPQGTAFDVVYTSLLNTCTDTLTKGLFVTPPATPVLTLVPGGFAPFSAVITPANPAAVPPILLPTVAASAPQTIQIVNIGNAPLNINAISTSGSCANFSVGPLIPPGPTVTLNQCESLPIIARYNGQTTAATDQCTISVSTNAGTKIINLIGSSQ